MGWRIVLWNDAVDAVHEEATGVQKCLDVGGCFSVRGVGNIVMVLA